VTTEKLALAQIEGECPFVRAQPRLDLSTGFDIQITLFGKADGPEQQEERHV